MTSSDSPDPSISNENQKEIPDPWDNSTLLTFVQTGIFSAKVSKSEQNKVTHLSSKLGKIIRENNKLFYFPVKNNFNIKLEIPKPVDRPLIICDAHQLGHFGPQTDI